MGYFQIWHCPVIFFHVFTILTSRYGEVQGQQRSFLQKFLKKLMRRDSYLIYFCMTISSHKESHSIMKFYHIFLFLFALKIQATTVYPVVTSGKFQVTVI